MKWQWKCEGQPVDVSKGSKDSKDIGTGDGKTNLLLGSKKGALTQDMGSHPHSDYYYMT